ncbi:MAG: hypothetical protein LH606_01465 [Cytophagaceae bacterium]|nr:hypothetical protein [Cytophagaceae bacterium]
MPGKLSAAHAQFATNCAACHTALKGIDEAKCISCHASNKALLQRQPTAFHANIGNCASCHIEHQGADANLRVMNHQALAQIGARLIPAIKSVANQMDNVLLPGGQPLVSTLEATLDCASCHATTDKHQGLFGQTCASCHATSQWTIPTFQHPSMRSTDCVQCHQAPPSHYMMHFEMVSKKVAAEGKAQLNGCCEGVIVRQCYVCHQTTSWNDIKGVGYYKHH